MTDTTWMTDAACRGSDPSLFFLEKHHANLALPMARAICEGCPVVEQCRDYALHHEQHGTWAGITRRERQETRGRLGITLEPVGLVEDVPTIDSLDDGTRTAREIAEALGLTVGAILKHRHRAKAAA